MSNSPSKVDAILIGAGIMSATLGVLLKELAPDWNITMFERLEAAGEESSNERNNSGTGHAALCELNYTTEQPDGTINIDAAIRINERFCWGRCGYQSTCTECCGSYPLPHKRRRYRCIIRSSRYSANY